MTRRRPEIAPGVVAGESCHLAEDGRVLCDACPRHCRLRDGQHGLCVVRQARGSQIALTVYGRSTGFCVDPIEKKPLNHFFPGTSVLSFGTAGCNLSCRFCQNWEISRAREAERLSHSGAPDDVATAALAHGCRSVAFTYNDPVVFQEYALDTALACRERGLKAIAVTAGYATQETRELLYSQMDAINVDLKSLSERFYQKLCFAHLKPVLDTLRYLKHETNVWFEVTNLLIPGQNDAVDEVARLCEWMFDNVGPDVPLHFSAFRPAFRMANTPPTSLTTLKRAVEQARATGLRYVYAGNVREPEQQSTFCHRCGALLIERDGYEILRWGLAGEACARCGTRLPGHFGSAPGAQDVQRMRARTRRGENVDERRVGC